MFRSVVHIKWKDIALLHERNLSLNSNSNNDSNEGAFFSSESWEKNKRYSQQSAAIVALNCLDVQV